MVMRFAALVLALAACGQKNDAPPAPSAPVAAPAPPPAVEPPPPTTVTVPRQPAKADKPKASKEQIADYRKHLAAGRKLAKAGKWGEAAKELEACLTALPGDARALGEWGWALFNAGDYPRARKASADAAKQAIEISVKASSLYNLGRVEEATGDVAGAARHYAESIILRPNKTVSDRLTKLGSAAPAPGSEPPTRCTTPGPVAKLCECIKKEYADAEDADRPDRTCALADSDLAPGLRVLTADSYTMTQTRFAVAKVGGDWQIVRELEDIYNPGAFGISEEATDISAKTRTIAGHQVAELTWSKIRSDSDMGINEAESEETEMLAICVLGSTITCPVVMPTRVAYERGPLFDDPKEMGLEDLGPPMKPIKHEHVLTATIGEDGVATIVLAKGIAEDWVKALIGQKKLW